ncbi:flap endonuclease-1 [Candidatus Woesearchaeota archaeon]|nr:flap endonuclease-1 [Candidatus Woesearchaeota archaeon]
MGVNLKDIVVKKEISIADLRGKRLVVDSYNILYQFLATIRQMDGTPLTDSKGQVTSHLIGLLHRTTRLMQKGMRLAFVFDGEPPALKSKERQRRSQLKQEAQGKFEDAERAGDVEAMKKYAMRTSRLTPEMVREAKSLIEALGLPVIQAPSEGEAQAAYMVKKGEVYAEISQDYDCLLFGVPRLVQNLTISERKKMPNKLSFETVKPQQIDLAENLKELGISHTQLIALGILVGTDFNPGGIKGIGPKNALKLVKEHGEDFEKLFSDVHWSEHFDHDWREVFDIFTKLPSTDDYELKWKPVNREQVLKILVDRHDFSKQRVEDVLEKLKKDQSTIAQKGLGGWM